MSLPTAKQQINSNPAANAVTAPTVKADKDADVEQKLKIYGMIQAFRQGSLPSNKQIDDALLYAEKHSPVDIKALSPDGQKLIADIRDIVETARTMVKVKNSDELFQNFVWHTQVTDTARGAQSKDALPVSKGEVQKDAEQASVHLRTLLTLILTNSEARKVIADLGIVGRDLFATAAVKVADKARPEDHQLDQVDKEAPSNQWEGADGKTHGTDETPKLQINVAGHSITHDPKAPIASGTVARDRDGNEINAGEAYQKGKEAKAEAANLKEQAKSQAKDVAQDKAQQAKEAHDRGGVEGVKNAARNEADKAGKEADANVSEEDKETVKSKFAAFKDKIMPDRDQKGPVDKTKEFLDDEFPQERRDQFIYRLKKVVVECQKHNDYDSAINFFLDLLENYKGHAAHLGQVGADSAGAVSSDPAFSRAYEEMKTLLERFANGKSLNGVIDAVNNLYRDAQDDKDLRRWWNDLSAYVRKTLLEPGFVLEDECSKEGDDITERGKKFFDQKYAGHKDAFFDETTAWFKAMGEDPLNVRFGEDWKRLTKDILFDENGSLEFKPQLWNDIRTVILPTLINQSGYIPIPRIEYTDKQVDMVIENLVLQGTNLFPNVVELEANNFFKFSPYKGIADESHHKFRFHFSQIQADMRDVGFFFAKKQGFPKIKDSGLADVQLLGKGLSVDVTLESAGKRRRDKVFIVKNVDASVHALKFSIRESKHDLLYKIASPLASGLIKKAIGLAVENAIKTGLDFVNEQLVEVRNKMEEAKESDSTTRTQALKDLYVKKKDTVVDNKEKASQTASERGSQFAIVTDRKSMILPNAHVPESTQEKAFEKEDLAKKGSEWRSPAFALV